MYKPVTVKAVAKHPIMARYQLLLKTEDERFLKLHVADREGESIHDYLYDIKTPRPLVYDIINELVNMHKIAVERVLIDKCTEEIFHAKLAVKVDGEERLIDCRPSDAIAISLKLNLPIFALEYLVTDYQ